MYLKEFIKEFKKYSDKLDILNCKEFVYLNSDLICEEEQN